MRMNMFSLVMINLLLYFSLGYLNWRFLFSSVTELG